MASLLILDHVHIRAHILVSLVCVILRGSSCSELPLRTLSSTGAVTLSLLRNNDSPSRPIMVDNPGIPFLQNRNTSVVFVSDNGLISFNQEITDPPQSPGIDFSELDETPVIAPFWSDNDIRLSGGVKYELYSLGASTNIDNELSLISSFIESKTGMVFNATWMLLVEWSECHPFPHGEPGGQTVQVSFTNLTNTYQAIVITDQNTQSYAIFIYQCDLIQWGGIDHPYARVGVAMGSSTFSIHALSGIESVSGIDCLNRPLSNEVNIVYDLTTFDEVGAPSPDPSTSLHTMASTSSDIAYQSTSSLLILRTGTIPITSTSTTFSMSLLPVTPTSTIISSPRSTSEVLPGPAVHTIIVPIVVILLAVAATVTIVICLFLLIKKKKKGRKVQPVADTVRLVVV